MKIAISQRQTIINDRTYDCLEHTWHKTFKGHDIYPIPNIVHLDLECDLLVLSGGENTQERFLTEINCYNYAMVTNIPILGVCHGAFLLNYVYDGLNKEVKGHQNTTHDIEMEGETFQVNSYHEAGIYTLGKTLDIVATDPDGNIEAFKHNTLEHWGIVWHPERMEEPLFPSGFRKFLDNDYQ